MTIKIGPYSFMQTCMVCPEQYDVFDEDGNQVAYVRLRHGYLSATCPDVEGVPVWFADLGDEAGCFRSDKERAYYLDRIAREIRYHYEREKTNAPGL